MPNFHGLPLSMTPSFDSSSLSSLSNSRGHASSHDEKVRRIDDAVKIKRFFFSVSPPLLSFVAVYKLFYSISFEKIFAERGKVVKGENVGFVDRRRL